MRNRYFSPDTAPVYPANGLGEGNKLRWVGSMKKLPSIQQFRDEQNIKKIGQHVYRLEKQIGSGYSSKVFKAVRLAKQQERPKSYHPIAENQTVQDQQIYAIKVIELKKYSSSNMQMLKNQIKILRMLDHPNIIKCFDVHRTHNHCYFVTEYCPNGDLLQYLTRKGRLGQSAAVQVINDVIEGYKYLISKGVIHRDLKPANILRGLTGWKIADFGFAIESETEIKSRYNVGTPLYMPLESLAKNIYSVKSDIFAIGIIYYQLIIGATPWQCKSERELIKKLSNIPFKIPEKFNSRMSFSLRQLLKKMCQVEAPERMARDTFLELDAKGLSQNPEEVNNQSLISKGIIAGVKLDIESQLCQVQRESNREIRFKSIENLLKLNSVTSKSTDDEEKKVEERQESGSNHILIGQLHFCRFLYYLIKNSVYFNVGIGSRDRICLVLFKHLLKVVKQLSDSTVNWFKLTNWEQFRNSKKYIATLYTMKDYASRYEKEYLSFLKKLDIAVIRQINKQLHSFASAEHISAQFYKQLSEYLAPQIREFNHNLSQNLHQSSYALTPDVKASIHALHSLNKYRNLLHLCSGDLFMNFADFEKRAEIKVHVDYRTVTNWNMLEDYVNLRKELKFI